MKYAVKIPFGDPLDENTWVFLMEPDRKDGFDDLHIMTFDTPEAAEKEGSVWRDHKVVEYPEK